MDPRSQAALFHLCLEISNGCWIALAIIWIAGSFRNKRTSRGWNAGTRLPYFLLLALTYGLVFNSWFGPRILPESVALGVAGACLSLSGCATAIWARFTLASNWSASVTVKEGHELVQRGPYRWIRHPIYSGILQALAGAALLTGTMGAAAGISIAVVQRIWKLRLEERLMAEQFPETYPIYKDRTKALVPFVF